MGGFCTTNVDVLPDPKEVLSGTQIPEWVSSGGRSLFQQAAELAESPYPGYKGDRFATYTGGSYLTDAERSGLGLLTGDRAGDYIGQLSDASRLSGELGSTRYDPRARLAGDAVERGTLERDSFTRGADVGGMAFDADAAQRYADMYQRAVSPAMADVTETFNRRQQELAAGAGSAFGGDRYAIQAAQMAGQEGRERGRLAAQAGQAGLEFGASQMERDRADRFNVYDRNRSARESEFQLGQGERFGAFDREQGERFGAFDRMQGERFGAYDRASAQEKEKYDLNQAARRMGIESRLNIGQQMQQQREQEARGRIGAGEAQRTMNQRALDTAYKDYLEQREYPFQQLNYALGALQGVPYDTKEYSMQRGGQMVQTPSIYGQTMGGLGALATAYRLMGNR